MSFIILFEQVQSICNFLFIFFIVDAVYPKTKAVSLYIYLWIFTEVVS